MNCRLFHIISFALQKLKEFKFSSEQPSTCRELKPNGPVVKHKGLLVLGIHKANYCDLPSLLSISSFDPESIAKAEILPESHLCSSLYQFYKKRKIHLCFSYIVIVMNRHCVTTGFVLFSDFKIP